MKNERLRLVGALLLLSGLSAGYMQAAPHAAAVKAFAAQQNDVCKGVVIDKTGETVIGASVVVKGTTNGTITDFDGNFTLTNVKKMLSRCRSLATSQKNWCGTDKRSRLH